MRWSRDRLPGLLTDGLMVGMVVTVTGLFFSWYVHSDPRPEGGIGGREILLLALLVSAVVAGYSTLQEAIYRGLHRLLRPHRARLHQRAEQLYRACEGVFELIPLLQRLLEECADMMEASRIDVFLPDEEEQVLAHLHCVGCRLEDMPRMEIPLQGPLGDWLTIAPRGGGRLPVPAQALPAPEDALHDYLIAVGRGVAIPLRLGGAITGLCIAVPGPGARLDREGVRTVTRLLERMAVLIEDARLYTRARRESREKDLVFEVGRRISATLDQKELLDLILDGLEQVVGFDAAGIFLVDRRRAQIDHHILRGYDDGFMRQVDLKVGQGLVGLVAEGGEPILVTDVRRHPGYVEARPTTRSELAIPVVVEQEVIAVINLESDRLDAYERRDLRLLEVFAAQAAVALHNARLYQEALEKRSLDQELELAGEIQRALLPRHPPEVKGLEVATYFNPSRSVGGDLYDLVPLSDNRLGIAIGDVSGKGTPAAILMASLYASFRSLTRGPLTLPQIMRRLNNLLCENFGAGRYATFFYALLDAQARRLTYSNAGHFPPLLLRPGEEPILLSQGGIVLGYIPDSDYPQDQVDLEPGDLIVCYTDGLIEAQNSEGEMFGEERVVEVAATLIGQTAREVLAGLRRAVERHCADTLLDDDMTLVVVRVY